VHGIHHVDLVVSDLERSLAFSPDLLGPLGYVREGPIRGERGERVVYLATSACTPPSACASHSRTPTGRPTTATRSACTTSRSARPHATSWTSGRRGCGTAARAIESEPAEYDYIPDYHAVSFHDPDGHRRK
jgi:glyoxylase I family protein